MTNLAGDSRQDQTVRTNNLRDDLGARIDSVRDELGGRIDSLREELGSEIQKVRAEAASNHELPLKHVDTRFYWTLTTMVAMTVIIGSMKM